MCVCVRLVICGFVNVCVYVWVCVCVGFVICGCVYVCVYVWVCLCVGFVIVYVRVGVCM